MTEAVVVKGMWAGIVALLLAPFGGPSVLLYTLGTLILVDFITGFIAACITRSVTARKFFIGGGKKIMILALVVMGNNTGVALNLVWLREAVIMYFILGEALSICENAVVSGIKVPSFLFNILKKAGELAEQGQQTKIATTTTSTEAPPDRG